MSRKLKKRRSSTLNKPSGNYQIIFQKAVELHQAGRLKEAANLYNEILRTSPKHGPSLNFLGLIAQQSGDYGKAVKLAKKAVSIQTDAAFLCNLGSAYRGSNKLPEAETAFKKAHKIGPSLIEAQFNLALTLIEQNKSAEAICWFQKVLNRQPHMIEALEGLGQAYNAQGKFKEALQCSDTILEINPKLANAHLGKGLALQGMKQFTEAHTAYKEAIKHDPKQAESYNNIGNIFQELKTNNLTVANNMYKQ